MNAETVIQLPAVSLIVKNKVALTTRREASQGPTPVQDTTNPGSDIAWWGPANNDPARVNQILCDTSITGGIIDKKTEMLVSGGLRYGKRVLDERTGMEMLRPLYVPEIEYWLQDSNHALYNYEATRDFYTHGNAFCELQLGKGRSYATRISAPDASHVRLGVMNKAGFTQSAYLQDWNTNTTANADAVLAAVDPYGPSPFRQIMDGSRFRYILPLRFLGNGRFYYGRPSWHSLSTNGWIDINKRIPELKSQLLDHLMHLSFHIEADERYWPRKFPEWAKKTPQEQIALMVQETTTLNDALQGNSQGGAILSSMLGSQSTGTGHQESLLKVTPIKNSILSGVYLEDSQEADFVICRDMGLPPPLYGISPSKTGNSAGSGSVDRVLRTNFLLDSKPYADLILTPYSYVSRINDWDRKYNDGMPITWWFANYYAATLDRTMQVGDLNRPNINQKD